MGLKESWIKYNRSGKGKARRKALKDRNKEFIRLYKSERGCNVCGERDPIVLDAHHLYDKKHEMPWMQETYSLERVLDELKKCEILCANCHRRRHSSSSQ